MCKGCLVGPRLLPVEDGDDNEGKREVKSKEQNSKQRMKICKVTSLSASEETGREHGPLLGSKTGWWCAINELGAPLLTASGPVSSGVGQER